MTPLPLLPVAAALLLAAPPTFPQTQTQTHTQTDPEPPAIRLLREALRDAVRENRVAGAAVRLEIRGNLVLRHAEGDLDPDAPFQVASAAKAVTAAAALVLVDRGRLDLHEPVSRLVPEFDPRFPDGTPPATPVTLAHLLSNTSGLPPDVPDDPDPDRDREPAQIFGGAVSPRLLLARSLADSVRTASRLPLVAQPGEQFHYCTLGFNVAARAVEVAAQKPFAQHVRETLLQPLGMNRTEYAGFGNPLLPRPPGETPFLLAGGAMTSTIDDLAAFDRMLLRRGLAAPTPTNPDPAAPPIRVLSESAVDLMRTPRAPLSPSLAGPLGLSYGLGLFLQPPYPPARPNPNQNPTQPQPQPQPPPARAACHAGVLGSLPWVDFQTGLVGVVLVKGPLRPSFQLAFKLQNLARAAVPDLQPAATAP